MYENMTPEELTRIRFSLILQLGEIEEETERRRKANRLIMRVEEQQWKELSAHNPMALERRAAILVSPDLGFNVHNFHAVMVEIGPHHDEGAYHRHGEAIKYYVEGRAVEIIGDKRYEVKAGDTVFIPADTWHGTMNPYDAPARYLAVAHSGLGVPVMKWAVFKTREDLKLR